MNAPRSLLLSAVLACVACPATPAFAANPDPAQEMFNRGIEHLEAGRFDQACPAIESSYKLDPRPGTLFTLADCEEQRGRLATALRRYDEYLSVYGTLSPESRAKQGDREKVAREHQAALAARVPELTLALPANAPVSTRVTRDGVVVERLDLGVPIRVDPGDHVIVTQGPGGAATSVQITLGAGDRRGIALVVAGPATGPVAIAAPDRPEPPAGSSWRLYTGSTLLGLGLAFAVTGVVSTTQVLGAQSTIDAKRKSTPEPASYDWCASANTSRSGLGDACHKAYTFQTLEGVAYPAAAAFIGAGIYLVVTHRQALKQAATSFAVVPAVGPRLTGLDASLRF